MEIEIPALPEDLTALTDAEIEALLADLLALENRLYENDPDLVEGATNEEVIAAMTTVVERIQTVRAESEARVTAAAETAEQMAALHQAAVGTEGAEDAAEDAEAEDAEDAADAEAESDEAEADSDVEDVEGEVVEEVAVSAAARRPFVRQPGTRIEVNERDMGMRAGALVACADLPGFSPGQPIENLLDLAHALIKRHDGLGRGGGNGKDKVIVASARNEYPDDRLLSDDPIAAMETIREVIGGPIGSPQQMQALAASGGLCAPTVVNYAVDVLGVADEPVGASLPKFQAARGGIRYTFGPTLADITSGISSVTAAEDAAGYGTGTGETAPKDCLTIHCPTFVEVLIDAIATCIQFGNFQSRTYPELVQAWQSLMGIALAQTKEVKRLDAIKAGSTAVTTLVAGSDTVNAPPVLGIKPEFTQALVLMTAAWRSRWRLADGTRFRALMPRWVPDAIVADDAMRAEYEGTVQTREQAIAHIRQYVDPVFYLDSPTSQGMMFGAQSTGDTSPWIDTFQWALYPEGTWIELDGGTLDVGLIRDSALVATNDYILFAEEFLNLARVGPQSLWATTDYAVTGSSAALVTVTPS